jgi:hypothetical protein
MTLRHGVVVAGMLALLLCLAFAMMVGDAVVGGDWPGWDEGWAVLAFPLGVPVAVAAATGLLGRSRFRLRVLGVTAAVWAWGAVVFLLWLAFG